ncbi:TetR/AcrR family transcriptional regulator [Nocardia cyriacigeorgica]|uniref:TetR/AcrR family transcriptional regulator n=1 Tax=Nocardia cyriacigeorgica TaxID=135487 RepID=A0A6P1DHE7_9NOCA|nr:TetR/AcrR family transcriptional regulator [Nocardia cyriacigeorgica]
MTSDRGGCVAVEEREIQSVWTRPQRRRRDQPALSREQIVAEAVALLDAEGVAALSMRKLGAKLNAGATSLYTHVANKDELIELVTDEVLGELPTMTVPDPSQWRSATMELAKELRATILRHPWLASVLGEIGTVYLGPNMMRVSDSVLETFEAAGFDMAGADHAMNVVFSYVLGNALAEAASVVVIARSGVDEEEWMRRVFPAAEAAARPYPTVHKRYTSSQDPAWSAKSRDESFAHELGLILNGIDPAAGNR